MTAVLVLLAMLCAVLRDEPARRWLATPKPDLDGRTPLQLIAEGEHDRVVALILAMGEGMTA